MPPIGHALAQRLLDRLGDDPLADELRSALAQSNSDAGVTLIVPLSIAPHVASALRVGAASARMCGHPVRIANQVFALGSACEGTIPTAFSCFLHGLDVERAFTMASAGPVEVTARPHPWRYGSWTITIGTAGASRESLWTPTLRVEMDEADARRAAAEIGEFLSRIRPLDQDAPDDGDSPDGGAL